jgi:hypothetical protein
VLGDGARVALPPTGGGWRKGSEDLTPLPSRFERALTTAWRGGAPMVAGVSGEPLAGLARRGELTAFVAPSQTGTTMLALGLVDAVVRDGGHAVVLDYDANGPGIIGSRLDLLGTDASSVDVIYRPQPLRHPADLDA